jgi:hypothetical protein
MLATNRSTYFYQSLSDLPRENAWVFLLHFLDSVLDFRRGDSRFGSADDSRPNRARFLVAVEDLGHASVRHSKLAGNHTRTNAAGCQLDDFQTNVVGKWPAIDENSAKLEKKSFEDTGRRKVIGSYLIPSASSCGMKRDRVE